MVTGLFFDRRAVFNRAPNRSRPRLEERKQFVDRASSSHLLVRLAEHSLGGFAGHEQPAGIVEEQNTFFQPLQQVLDIGPQFVGVLFGAAVLLVQQAEFGVDVGELPGFAPRPVGPVAKLAGADQIDTSAHALQRIQNDIGQHRAQKNRDAQRQCERQQQALQSRFHGMLQ